MTVKGKVGTPITTMDMAQLIADAILTKYPACRPELDFNVIAGIAEEEMRCRLALGDVIVATDRVPTDLDKIKAGMTKAEVRAILGPPTDWSTTTNKYIEPAIWKYGDVEIWFLTEPKRRVPYPGPKVSGIYIETEE